MCCFAGVGGKGGCVRGAPLVSPILCLVWLGFGGNNRSSGDVGTLWLENLLSRIPFRLWRAWLGWKIRLGAKLYCQDLIQGGPCCYGGRSAFL